MYTSVINYQSVDCVEPAQCWCFKNESMSSSGTSTSLSANTVYVSIWPPAPSTPAFNFLMSVAEVYKFR